mmetsp:Transcript_40726/g.47358  ORF Transcript_40726/g.47358 Transcript_40726/m.47358 type:complete len:247 (-) Transcript_40726:331-1071(-)
MNGHRFSRNRRMDSLVCCSKPCMMSTTRTAMSHRLLPRLRRFVKDSWPGVSMTRSPGTSRSYWYFLFTSAVASTRAERGKNVAPICCVIPPASPPWTLVERIRSKRLVFPVSTWPKTQQIGERKFDTFSRTCSASRAFASASAFAFAAASFLKRRSSRRSSRATISSQSSRISSPSDSDSGSGSGSTCFGATLGAGLGLGFSASAFCSARTFSMSGRIMPAALMRSSAEFLSVCLSAFFITFCSSF